MWQNVTKVLQWFSPSESDKVGQVAENAQLDLLMGLETLYLERGMDDVVRTVRTLKHFHPYFLKQESVVDKLTRYTF